MLFAALALTFARGVFPVKYESFVNSAAVEFGLSKAEVYAVIRAESGFDENAVSRAGAVGLMQLMPSTADFCKSVVGLDENADTFDPEINIRLGCCYLDYLRRRFDGDNVYAAYNAGEGRVNLWLQQGGGIPIKETSDYVKRVKLYKKIYSFLYGDRV